MNKITTALFYILSLLITPLSAGEKIGVILMHGKWGTALPSSPIGPLAEFIDQNDFVISTPEMPWSRERGLDKSYEDAMLEIDMHVSKLRSEGITKIVIGGRCTVGKCRPRLYNITRHSS